MIEVHRTIEVFSDEDYYYTVHTAEEFSIAYTEGDVRLKQVFFASKAEMKAVALAMLELAEKE
jgi:disulfide oxidoreductase YuzD